MNIEKTELYGAYTIFSEETKKLNEEIDNLLLMIKEKKQTVDKIEIIIHEKPKPGTVGIKIYASEDIKEGEKR